MGKKKFIYSLGRCGEKEPFPFVLKTDCRRGEESLRQSAMQRNPIDRDLSKKKGGIGRGEKRVARFLVELSVVPLG